MYGMSSTATGFILENCHDRIGHLLRCLASRQGVGAPVLAFSIFRCVFDQLRRDFLIAAAHCSIRHRLTSVESVKLSLRTIGLFVISAPMVLAEPVSMEIRHGGTPARRASSTASRRGGAGLTTSVQPAPASHQPCA